MAGNKSDLIEQNGDTKKEGKKLARKINAIFKMISAEKNQGIEDLFETIPRKYFDDLDKKENREIVSQIFILNYIIFSNKIV